MKGTLFSADFIKDSSSNLRLLELNTDTGFISNTLDTRFDFTAFKTLLSDNNITELVLIYKLHQENIIEKLETYIAANATFITTVTKQVEDANSIYPAAVTDSASKFILRLAYDENALFDSTYCKERANVQKLFYDNSATGSIPEFYYSGSEYVINTLTSDLNAHSILPDLVVKDKTETFSPLKFIKFGNAESSSADRIADYVNNYIGTSQTVEKFHYEPSDITDDNKLSAIRVFGIVYGSDINHVIIGQYKVPAFFELPTSDTLSYIDSNAFINNYKPQHYFEFTSNYLRFTVEDAIHKNETLVASDDSDIQVENVEAGSILKSMYIAGAPDTDDLNIYRQWFSTGSSFPSGSFVTSSVVTSYEINEYDNYGVSGIITLANDEKIYTSITKNFLTYNTGSDEFRFLQQYQLVPTEHFLVDKDANKVNIVSNDIGVLENNNEEFFRIDVEATDSYFVSSSQNAFIVHNAPCFVAGTPIHTEDGIKNIEDVKVGDKVITYNHDNDIAEYKEVLSTMVKENEYVVTYVFENGTELTGTPDHPLFVLGKGYSSYSPQATKEDSNLDVEQILIGDEVLHLDGYGVTITDIIEDENTHTVYNLDKVADNHNFYAWDFLSHNRAPPPGSCCFIAGTQISLSNNDSKNIEDIIVGDEVIGWKDGERINSIVTELKPTYLGNRSLYNINDLKITFTDEHPFLTKDGWKSIAPDEGTEYGLLVVGDEINHEGEWITINEFKEIEGEDYNQPVYNFTVEDIHSYIADGVIVHNK
jgi:hypothetical protein